MLIIDVDCGGERQTLGPAERESLEAFGVCRPYSLPGLPIESAGRQARRNAEG